MTFLADHLREPAVAKTAKDGWQAATKYYFGFYYSAKFTKRLVPECAALFEGTAPDWGPARES